MPKAAVPAAIARNPGQSLFDAHWPVAGDAVAGQAVNDAMTEMPAAANAVKRKPKSGYTRLRDYRARRRNGEAIATVTYGPKVLDLLLAAGWLREADAGDRTRVGAAIAAMLADASKSLKSL
jgi:hypothetical protein